MVLKTQNRVNNHSEGIYQICAIGCEPLNSFLENRVCYRECITLRLVEKPEKQEFI